MVRYWRYCFQVAHLTLGAARHFVVGVVQLLRMWPSQKVIEVMGEVGERVLTH